MEQKLKKQRNRLIGKVTLILIAVWTAVSVTYCFIRLHNEKSDMQAQTLSDLSYAKQILSMSELDSQNASRIYLNDCNLLYFKDMADQNPDTQLVLIDPDSGATIADTAGKILVKFSFMTPKGTYPDDYGYIHYNSLRQAMSDSQYGKIIHYLTAKSDDGRSYELVCTRFFTGLDEIIPLELAIVLVEGAEDANFNSAEIVETFPLRSHADADSVIYSNSDYRINLIPKDFFLKAGYDNDYIGGLAGDEREKSVSVTSQGAADYIFFISEYFFLDGYIYSKEQNAYVNSQKLYLLQFAKKANLLENCAGDIARGVAVILGFFIVIGCIICVMVWNTVRAQIIQEQKRLDFTNALAHDIKTPLFVISGYAYSLKENIDSNDRESYLDKIILQTEQINALVHKMLNLSKLDSTGMTLNRSEFDLAELVTEILDDYKALPEGRKIAFSKSGESKISADRELIRTALQNLIENAVKYSLPESETMIDVAGVSITISNPCEHISKSDLKKIWQPYYRMDKSRHKKGNGLGLSIVKSILDLHGAKYDMSMKEGCMVFHAEL